jgi:hypothetical protein
MTESHKPVSTLTVDEVLSLYASQTEEIRTLVELLDHERRRLADCEKMNHRLKQQVEKRLPRMSDVEAGQLYEHALIARLASLNGELIQARGLIARLARVNARSLSETPRAATTKVGALFVRFKSQRSFSLNSLFGGKRKF